MRFLLIFVNIALLIFFVLGRFENGCGVCVTFLRQSFLRIDIKHKNPDNLCLRYVAYCSSGKKAKIYRHKNKL